VLGKVASDNWIDECERADQLVEPLSLHTIQLRYEFSDDAIAELQAEDSEIGKAYEVMSENLDPSTDEFRDLPLKSRRFLSMQPEVRLQDNFMVKERDGRVQVVVPVTLRKRLFEITHNAAHLGSRRTYQQLNTSYYWYGMRQDIIRWYHQCQHCAKGKGPPLRPHGQLQKIPVGAPMDLVTMDILSGLPTVDNGSKYLLVVVDAFTKWVEAVLTSKPRGRDVRYSSLQWHVLQVRTASSTAFRPRSKLRETTGHRTLQHHGCLQDQDHSIPPTL